LTKGRILSTKPATLEERIAEALQGRALDVAATEAIRGYGPEILGYLRSTCRSPEDAGDVFSQFAEDLWRALPSFRGATTLRAFAYKIAWHAAARFYADAYRRRRKTMRTSMASKLAASVHVESKVELERDSAQLMKIRAELGPEEQTLLVLRLDRGLPWEEIAEVLAEEGKPADQAALRKRFERLKSKIARMAREQGLLDK